MSKYSATCCEKCGGETSVIESRKSGDNGRQPMAYKRRRKCLECGERYTTYELKSDDLSFDISDLEKAYALLNQSSSAYDGGCDIIRKILGE